MHARRKTHFEALIGDVKKKKKGKKNVKMQQWVLAVRRRGSFRSKNGCHLSFSCFNSFLKQRGKKNWWLRCVMENFQSRVRRWLETICCPRTEPSANAEEEQMCWFAYYWRLCPIERIHFITNNGLCVHLQFKPTYNLSWDQEQRRSW